RRQPGRQEVGSDADHHVRLAEIVRRTYCGANRFFVGFKHSIKRMLIIDNMLRCGICGAELFYHTPCARTEYRMAYDSNLSSRSGNLTQLLSDLAVEVFPRDTRVCFFGSPQPCVVIQRQHGSLHLGAGSATRNAGKRIALDFYRSAFTGFHDDAAIIAAVDIRGCVIVSNPGIDILGFYSVGNRMPDWCFTRGEPSSAQTEDHHPEKCRARMARILHRRGREFVLRMLGEGRIVPQLFKTLPVNLFYLYHMMVI